MIYLVTYLYIFFYPHDKRDFLYVGLIRNTLAQSNPRINRYKFYHKNLSGRSHEEIFYDLLKDKIGIGSYFWWNFDDIHIFWTQICFCLPEIFKTNILNLFWLQNHHLNLCFRVVKKPVWNFRIKAFYYTKYLMMILSYEPYFIL